jgi:hypothetical protein
MFNCKFTAFFLLAICLCTANNCLAYEEAYRYLSTKSQLHLDSPVCVFVTDNRPQEQRSGDSSGFWQYTVDDPNNMSPALGLGIDICQLMEKRGITSTARVALPGETAPDGCVILNVSLESWYGRVRANNMMTEKVIQALSSSPQYIEGLCHFDSKLVFQNDTHDLGAFEGTVVLDQSREPISESEQMNKASAIAATQALADFFRSFEKQFVK